jgi:hypothetical protein
MSHEDFVAYVGEGRVIGGHHVTLVQGFDALHILELDRRAEIPLVFDGNEGFEARVARMVDAVEGWAMRHETAA